MPVLRSVGSWATLLAGGLWVVLGLSALSEGAALTGGTERITPTPTICPMATPEQMWVDPVTSPTEQLTQTVTVGIGNGDAVTVTTQSGTFAVMGAYNAFNNPAEVDIDLLPNTTHALTVAAHVRPIQTGGCSYGNYTLTRTTDRNGDPLVIVQVISHRLALPLVSR